MKTKYFHRFDDIGPYHVQVVKLLKYMDGCGMTPILAVIPDALDHQMATVIKSLKHCVVFQHGCRHQNRQVSGWLDEFPGNIALSEIEHQICAGREKLEMMLTRPIKGYVPPWNNTSEKTIKILEKLGYDLYSAQANNTPETSMAKLDISYDTNFKYEPIAGLKSLDHLYDEIISEQVKMINTGIMYHPNTYSSQEVRDVIRFVEQFRNYNLDIKDLIKNIWR